jgi:2-octaprenylphenol hydroxylase
MDAAELVEELRRLHREGKDIGQHLYLRRYERSRKHSAAMMLAGMQGFRELFAGAIRRKNCCAILALLADTLPALNLNSSQAMGLNDLPVLCVIDPCHTFFSRLPGEIPRLKYSNSRHFHIR